MSSVMPLHSASQIWMIFILLMPVATDFPFRNTSLSWQQRADDLVSRLTLEEIANFSVEDVHVPAPRSLRLGIQPYRLNSECLHGIVGQNATAWPQALGMAAAFRYKYSFLGDFFPLKLLISSGTRNSSNL